MAPRTDEDRADADDDGSATERPSKSARKRQMHDRQALGVQIAALSESQLQRLPLSDALRAAIREARRVSGHEARRRQMQYIGKLMREADFDALRAGYDNLMGATRETVVLMHRCERLRDALIAEEGALAPFLEQYPGVDVQWLRTKLRAARAERTAGKPPRHSRELYQWLHELLGAPGAAAAEPAA